MNPNVFRTLEYEQIREALVEYTMSYLGRHHVQNMSPSTDLRQIESWLSEVTEAKSIIAGSSSVPIPALEGIEAVMKALNKGYVLSPEQISQFARFLDSTVQLKQYMARKSERAPRVGAYALSLVMLDDLRAEIAECVEDGVVLDSASTELAKIRKKIGILEDRVRRKIELALQKYKSHLQESFHSQRGGRFVIPVKRDSKRLVKGTILDESASGQTVYIEPAEVAAQQAELTEALFAQEQEASRVLSMLTGWIERYQRDIQRNLEVVGHYDFVFAKAKLAKSMDARRVGVSNEGPISIRGGRHPLLGSNAQPLDFYIGRDFRTLIITGPNTGGKTVTLKTVGLLCLMVQSGLLVPVGQGSEFSVFHEVLADIGDGQSINQSLSTFSSHVRNVIDILEAAGPKALVLLDELATGTDPGEGIGLSIAVLESLHRVGAIVVATTHFNEIKQYAGDTPGFENARMEFDTDTLAPLYRLKIGQPGNSYALVIAEKLGVPEDIVTRAKTLAAGVQKGATSSFKPPVPQSTTDRKSRHRAAAKPDSENGKAPTRNKKKRDYQRGDRVWIHSMKVSGIYAGRADDRGNVIVVVKKKRMTINVKRISPYLSREELYPDADNYDLDIVLESKDVRRKRKIMGKRHVEGLSIDYSAEEQREKGGEFRN